MKKIYAISNRFGSKIYSFILLLLLPVLARADDLPAMKGATDWMVKIFISIAVTVLGLQIMYRLWQINQGQKEWAEVAKPILVTAAIVCTPAAISTLLSVMR